MANPVHVVALGIDIDLEEPDLGHPSIPGLWERLYAQGHEVPVEQRGLQCAGICRDDGVVAWMHLRQRANGRREAVHQYDRDKARHAVHECDEHKAYKERIVRVATEDGHPADTEVRAPGGRIITDALVDGANGLRIGWEIQLSTAAADGPRSVRERARKALPAPASPEEERFVNNVNAVDAWEAEWDHVTLTGGPTTRETDLFIDEVAAALDAGHTRSNVIDAARRAGRDMSLDINDYLPQLDARGGAN